MWYVVFHTAKIQNWKQFTTHWHKGRGANGCVSHCKDTKLKAIHNVPPTVPPTVPVVFHTAKIQNWKQFTTHGFIIGILSVLCFTLQRYKIESNSQLPVILATSGLVVFHTAKIQNWKQFTTNLTPARLTKSLCFTLQRYKIESNSQQKLSGFQFLRGCVSHCKDTKLKAIHN